MASERPLASRRLLMARARPGPSQIAAHLRILGAEVLEAPEIEAVPLERDVLATILGRLNEFGAVICACAPGVDAIAPHLPVWKLPVFAVGAEAARALGERGMAVLAVAHGACGDALNQHSALLRRGKLLLVTSDEGRPSLREELQRLGAAMEVVAIYRHVRRMPPPPLPSLDLVVLPSSSAARAVLQSEVGDELRSVPMIAMGPRTEAEALGLGATRVIRSETDSSSALVELALATVGTR